MKKKLALVFAAAFVALSLSACGGEKQQAENNTQTQQNTTTQQQGENDKKEDKKEGEDKAKGSSDSAFNVEITDDLKAKAKEFSVGMVTDTGGIDDKSFNQSTWEGLNKFKEVTGAKVGYVQSNNEADYVPNLTTTADEDNDLVIATGFLFEDSVKKVATDKPDTKFLIIDTPITDKPNVTSASFSAEEASYLVGVAAAETAKAAGKTKVGYLGGGDFPLIQAFEAGYEAGVKSVDDKMEIAVEYVGGFSDAGKGQSLASKMYDAGAYVIFHAAGGAGNGMIKEAKDRRQNKEEVWAIGVDKDQYADGIYEGDKSVILTSMVKRVDVAAFDISLKTLKGEFPGGKDNLYNIANNGVGIPEKNPNLSETVLKKVEEARENIKSGKVKVPTVPSRLQKK